MGEIIFTFRKGKEYAFFLHHIFSYGLEVIRETKGNIEDYMIRSIIQDIVDVLSLMMILSGPQLLVCFEICFFRLLSFFEKKKFYGGFLFEIFIFTIFQFYMPANPLVT